jgi:hypothetical protein
MDALYGRFSKERKITFSMNKEEYKAKSKELHDAKIAIFREQDMADALYIKENKPCEIGDEVSLDHSPEERAVVKGFKIGWDSDVIPIAFKLKKDGTEGTRQLHLYSAANLIYNKKQTTAQ